MTLTPPEHERSAAIDEAASWLAQTPRERIGRPIVPTLRERFGLTVSEACAALREANLRLARSS